MNLDMFNQFADGTTVTPVMLAEKGLVHGAQVKVLSDGELKKKLIFDGFVFSSQARQKAERAGATIR